MKLSSLAVREPGVRTLNPPHQVPIVAASSFVFSSLEEGTAIFAGEQQGHIYGRFGNPTVEAAADKIAALEGYGLGRPVYGLFCSSGMAAIATALLSICSAGDKILTHADLYGGSSSLIDDLAGKDIGRITTNLRDSQAVNDLLAHDKKVRLIYLETPSNPTMRCTDIAGLAALAHHHDCLLVVDNTFATPITQQPLLHGADIVVHSTTKYLNGHGSGVAGAIICHDEDLYREKLLPTYRLYGGSGNPWDAWLVLNGLKTLPLRMERHCANALKLAKYLLHHEQVKRVNYPGLSDHPDRPIADKQMAGYGGMLSFELRDGAAASAFMNALRFCTLTPTLGDVDTLVLHPATMSHRGIDPAVREAHGITDGLVRVSVGIEDIEDITEDIEQALYS
jgi:methionine-gamma-lyase